MGLAVERRLERTHDKSTIQENNKQKMQEYVFGNELKYALKK